MPAEDPKAVHDGAADSSQLDVTSIYAAPAHALGKRHIQSLFEPTPICFDLLLRWNSCDYFHQLLSDATWHDKQHVCQTMY